jgi:hypothetical protein
MNVVGIVLTLISILCTAGPIAGAVVVYQSDPAGLVVPPQVNEILNGELLNVSSFALPQLVSAEYNPTAHAETIVINFTNPVDMNFTLKEAYAEVKCSQHQVPLANATLSNPVYIPGGGTIEMTFVCAWTPQAEAHFLDQHAGASTINVDLTQLTVNVNDITVTINQPVQIPNLPLGN